MPISIILADKHEIFRQGLAALLNATEGITALAQADNGLDAWYLIQKYKPDIAIVEICMPKMTGIEVACKTIMAGLATQIILLTAQEDPSVAIYAQEAGVSGYVLKNDNFKNLLTALQIINTGSIFISSDICSKLRQLKHQKKTAATPSPKEQEVIRLIALGKSSKEIARHMNISPRTVDTYRDRLMNKIQAHSVADVVRYAVRVGIVE
ncbi:response regulator [Candidatus Nitrosacidococcus tergens]|uniref:Response regulator containing a CheY-like receiver domain and an HTH DNA-binding domain n=1 Tax=Candidatus Nitrosacidococcus tergens TaxID=553981 RepID=A0A7G1Q996_9GAMM|nr:response regulator transcription factor [Candidatus Nitrosacidococcus tergens]CAB1275489.1 Response regulator containing a CheY-like receiver domain and an HTH DNA-binding domain [Candidatus Nitrosacidococcus tergens]